MSFATPIRANHRRMCTYTPPSKSHFVSPFESALPNRPRNCTFHSRLKSRSFNAHLRPSANSFPFCTSKKRGGDHRSRLPSANSGFRPFRSSPVSSSEPSASPCSPCWLLSQLPSLEPRRSQPQSPITAPGKTPPYFQQLTNSVSRNSCIPKRLRIPGGGGLWDF